MINFLEKKHTDLHTIANILILVGVLHIFIALIKDRAFAYYFGPGDLFDVFTAAFKIPDLFVFIVSSFVAVYVVLPILEKHREKGKVNLKEFINTVFYFLLLIIVVISTFLFFQQRYKL